MDRKVECPVCAGTGLIIKGPAGWDCPRCGGEGVVDAETADWTEEDFRNHFADIKYHERREAV